MTQTVLFAIIIGVPIFSSAVEWVASSGFSERHYRHHDTYVVSRVMSRVLVFAIIFMSALGTTIGWLCMVGVFHADPQVILAFFASFVLVTFVMWSALRHYRVTTFEDHMEIRPFIGRARSIRYADIEHLRWSNAQAAFGGNRNIAIVVAGKVAAVLIGTLDIEQILLRINRNDVIEGT